MQSARPFRDLTCFVPDLLLAQFSSFAENPAPDRNARGALLFADISGFSRLTSAFANHGAEGVEQLTATLNRYFSHLVDTVYRHGGDVSGFAGDALICLWCSGERDLTDSTKLAAACALRAQQTLESLDVRVAAGVGPIRMHMYITAGELELMVLPAGDGRRQFVAMGEPFAQLQSAAAAARSSDVAVSPQAWVHLVDSASGTALGEGWMSLGGAPPQKIATQSPRRRLSNPSVFDAMVYTYLPATFDRLLRADSSGWMAEIRRVTVLFARLRQFSGADRARFDRLRPAIERMCRTFARYEISLLEVRADDKGLIVIACLGLAFSSHEDDAERGVRAALELIGAAEEAGAAACEVGPLGIGVATGSVYCGVVGSELRSHYSLVGEPMNLAAALMCAAETGVLCDEATAVAVADRVSYRTTAPVQVKGRAEPVPVFVPTRPASEPRALRATRVPFHGRAEECARLDARLDRLAQRRGGLVWIEGEPGIGKTRLLAYLRDRAHTRQIRIGVGSGEAIERRTLYLAWRAVLRTALSNHPLVQALGERAAVLRWVQEDARLAAWTPLLEPLLLLGFEESEITRQIVGASRADATSELLVHLLRQLAAEQTMLLTFDDAHWIDSASWTLVAAVTRRAPELLIVVATRPLDASAGVELDLRNHRDTERLHLGPLTNSAMAALAASAFGIRSLPRQIERFLAQRAGGNPFFGEEISRALRDRGVIRIAGEECHLDSGKMGDELSDLPSTVQGIITARFDRLGPDEQLVLKIASTIGRSFSLDVLSAIHPVASQRDRLPETLRYLASLDLASLQPGSDQDHYAFKHAITQEVVYEMMTPSQKRGLHAAIAGWYETRHGERLEPYFALLAFHWGRAEELARAIVYLVGAGEQALAQHANAEAVKLFSDALRFDETVRVSVPVERAQWESQLADAYLKLSDFESCRRHLLESLRLLREPIPSSHHAQLMLVPIEWLRHSLRRFTAANREDRADERRLIAHLHQQRAEVAFFDHDHSSLLHAAVRCLNESEALGVSTELAYACGTVAIVAGIAGLHRIARTYLDRSLRISVEVGHLPTAAYVNQLAAVYYNGIGDWVPAEANICKAAELFNRLGDSYRWQSCLMIRAYLRMYRGDFAGVDELVEQVWPVVFPDGVAQVRAWCFAVYMFSTLPRRAVDRTRLNAGEEVFRDPIDTSEQILMRGALALGHARSRRNDEARRHADAALELIERFPPTTYHTMAGVAAVAESYLELWAEASATDLFIARGLAKRARAACAHLRRFARKFPFAVPRALLLDGMRHALDGRARRAAAAWRQCAVDAARRGMPYERGLALLLLGQHAGKRAMEHERGEGRALLAELGAGQDLERLTTAAPTLTSTG
jgi:hypothetical protein